MDVPPSFTDPETHQKTFYGEPSPSQVDAFCTLDEAVVRYLCEECEVVVKDVNYERAQRLEYRLFHATTYEERVYGMVDELKRELAAVKAERDMLFISDARYEILFSAGRMVSATFADILPLATLIVDGFGGASSTNSVMYTGSIPPATRVHQLAAFLENFMNRGSSIAGAVARSVRANPFFPLAIKCVRGTEFSVFSCLNRFDNVQDGCCVKPTHCYVWTTAGSSHFPGRVMRQ
jgi:hypothetical protein